MRRASTPEPELDRITVETQLVGRLDDLDSVKFGLGQHVLARTGRAVEVELPERARGDGDEGNQLVDSGEPDLRPWLEPVQVNAQCHTPRLMSVPNPSSALFALLGGSSAVPRPASRRIP